MNKKQIVILSSVIVLCFGLLLIIDELHEFGLPIPRIFPDLSQWHVEPLEHWMYGVITVCISLSLILTLSGLPDREPNEWYAFNLFETSVAITMSVLGIACLILYAISLLQIFTVLTIIFIILILIVEKIELSRRDKIIRSME